MLIGQLFLPHDLRAEIGRLLGTWAYIRYWIERTLDLIQMRQETGESWIRMAVILITVALFTIFSSLSFETKKARKRYTIADWLGKVSPFRIRINSKCDDCGACSFACR